MSKVAVVYWSGTGNTEIMANKVAEGAKAGGAEVEVFEAEGFSADKMDEFDAVAFGCPSMGCEELEDTIFEPMFASCESKLQGKKIALFGSYGWGNQEWMRDWEDRIVADGATVVNGEGIAVNGTPGPDAEDELKALGQTLASL